MDVYLSFSYRDVAINGYFFRLFVDEAIALQADQKTDVWCMAKLERYMREMGGFVSIIPARPNEADPGGYSPYIGQELLLARRSRVPRLLFVDDRVLARHQLDFPLDVVPFHADDLEEGAEIHGQAIRSFAARLETHYAAPFAARTHEAVVVHGGDEVLVEAAEDVAELLDRADFNATLLRGSRRSLDGVRLLERLWASELCVFLFGPTLSDTHLALAMAHAHAIPSVRLQHEPQPVDPEPLVSGLIRWNTRDDMLLEFDRQLQGYREGLVRPVELAQATTAQDAARAIGTMRWAARPENEWDRRDGPGLARHVLPEHGFVQDEVNRVRSHIGRALGGISDQVGTRDVCRLLYDNLCRYRFAYELEPRTSAQGVQAIRNPSQISTHRTATCLDVVCLFASLLEAAQQLPLLVVLDGEGFAHALAGYRVRDAPVSEGHTIGDLRAAVQLGDAVLVEATGATEADAAVGAERPDERHLKLLTFEDSLAAASRMLQQSDVRLRHLVDVGAIREAA